MSTNQRDSAPPYYCARSRPSASQRVSQHTPWPMLGLLMVLVSAVPLTAAEAASTTTTLHDFHWLRPLWLLALLPTVALLVALRRQQRRHSNWQDVIDSDLLDALSDTKHAPRQARWPLALLALAWLLAIFALAGPTWQRLPQPTFTPNEALVILFDLSASMYATDAKPSRLVQAQREIQDILRLRDNHGGSTALIAYAGDTHVVTPLTEDTQTIALLLPSLNPGMMPAQGNRPLLALQQAEQLIRDAQVERARILLITDGVPTADFAALTRFSQQTPYPLSILGIGSEAGAPIPVPRGGFLTNERGEVIIAKLNQQAIRDWAQQAAVRYQHSHFSDRDVDSLLASAARPPTLANQPDELSERTESFDNWYDFGPTLALLLLPLAALAFRRGWLLCLLLCSMLPAPQPAYAISWQDLWLNKNQQAQRALDEDDPTQAATLFSDEQWRGIARYEAGDYAGATEAFGQLDNSQSNYNRGNALAMQGELKPAIEAYERALELDPDNQDAATNKRHLEDLLQQQENQQQDPQQQGPQPDGEQPDGQQSDSQQADSQQQGDQQSDGQQSDGQQQDGEQQPGQQQNGNQTGTDSGEQANREPSDGDQSTESDSEQQQQAGTQNEGTDSTQQSADNTAPDDGSGDSGGQQENDEAADNATPTKAQNAPNNTSQEAANSELQQWLRQIPDEPGKLLQRKFDYQYRRQPQRPRDADQEERY